VIIIR